MKILKNVFLFWLVSGLILSCSDDDDVSFAFQNISAPTALAAVFDITQDDSGVVTLTPTATNATSFQVFYGDVDGETAEDVSPGDTAMHTYVEGEYTLRIVAIGLTGLTSELTRVVTISFTAPEDLAIVTEISAANPLEVTVTPTATNATVFDVFFGDEDNEEATVIMAGETATNVYEVAGDYTIRVVARGASVNTIEDTTEITLLDASGPIALPITFDDGTVNYALTAFNGVTYEVIENPAPGGSNPDVSQVGAVTNSGVNFEGGFYTLGTPVDFGGENKTITFDLWSDDAVPFLLKFEGGINGDERQVEVVADHTGSGWETLSFNFAVDGTKSFIDGNQGVGEPFVPVGQYAQLTFFIDGPGTTAGVFYIDNVEQEINLDPLALPITFDMATVDYGLTTFNGVAYEVVENPAPGGSNPDVSQVGAVTNSGVNFEGGFYTLGTPVDFSGDNKTITMQFWSDEAVPFLLKFEGGVNGDERQVEVVASHTGSGWEELSFNFAVDGTKSFIDGNQGVGEPFVPIGQYAQLTFFIDGPGTAAGVFYIDSIEQSTLPLFLPVDFDSAGVNYDITTFNGVTYEVVTNPAPGGTNPDVSQVGAITNSGVNFEGGFFSLDTPVDFSGANKTITLQFWSDVSVPFLLKFEGGVNGDERQVEVVATHGGTGWETLSFDFAVDGTKSFIDGNQGVGEPFVPVGQYAQLTFFIDGPGTTMGTFYIDDIIQE